MCVCVCVCRLMFCLRHRCHRTQHVLCVDDSSWWVDDVTHLCVPASSSFTRVFKPNKMRITTTKLTFYLQKKQQSKATNYKKQLWKNLFCCPGNQCRFSNLYLLSGQHEHWSFNPQRYGRTTEHHGNRRCNRIRPLPTQTENRQPAVLERMSERRELTISRVGYDVKFIIGSFSEN